MTLATSATKAERVAAPAPDGGAGHPFTPYLRTVGRGATLSRPLDEAEAEEALALILADRVEPIQLGGFLLVLRYRRETAAELAGFVRAARARIGVPSGLAVDLDWPSYADNHRQLPYFVLAARLLAGQGVRVLMHGIEGEGGATTERTLAALGIGAALTTTAAAEHLDATNFAFLPLRALCPELVALFDLRPLLGLRSPVNSLARALNPFAAAHQIQGVFHPTYLPLQQAAALRLGQPRAAIFKGGGGEAQRNPDKPCRVSMVTGGQAAEVTWPALTDQPHAWRHDPLDPTRVAALWHGTWRAPGPEAAVIGTTALALDLLGRADGQDAAHALARDLWADRNAAADRHAAHVAA